MEPVARGGSDQEANWITTSMVRNSAKANWTIAELGWQISPAGNLQDWDGLTGWFFAFVSAHPSHLEDEYVKRWHRAALRIQKQPKPTDPTAMSVTRRADARSAPAGVAAHL